ncbi:MAG: acetate kinase [Actinomycetota bacterium]|nr:acetate kinase [Actinomycetota bacterium]
MQVLVINSGSSSVKFELFEIEPARSLLRGEVERIGQDGSLARDHLEAFRAVLGMLESAEPPADVGEIVAVGHRVVHGGDRFTGPVTIDDGVLGGIREQELLAPLHTKANIAGIEAARVWLPGVSHVAVFDTTFYRTMPRHAREYALPRALAREHGIRRYGFHGTSHAFVAGRAAAILGRPLDELNLITLHLGNGASVAAIEGGRSIDTSMGMTPLEGLVMGTRCGDIDPAVPMLLGEITGRSREEVHHLLNFESGLAGLCGASDMREVHRLAEDGDADAQLAVEMFCYRAKKYIGAYYAVLGRVDAVVFTAGIGENDPEVRARICTGLTRLGIEIAGDANQVATGSGVATISPPGAEVTVLVIPTDEELEIARETFACAFPDRQPQPRSDSA